ncbi:hypothetical protein QQS21_012872 [Conoideocrella luteorostrata]|uniref:NDT80 domain-containing protein n=1 Tax=Conoideocrella luteorostrata TaxID=1105319 RepID=A0AAJ0FLY1_9HYPO|nr:hypothetical protein QQS21_012872 [Conoideocrella luteorostrata]
MDRYNQEGHNSSLTIDAPDATPLLSLFQPSNGLSSGQNYTHDSHGFYSNGGSMFTPDVRLRLSSNTASSMSMAHVQQPFHNSRATTLPHLGPHINSRDHFSHSIATFPRRGPDHFSRTSSFPVSRRQQLNGYTPSATRMDSHQFAHRASQNEAPPLLPIEMLGNLHYIDPGNPGMTAIKVEINGVIDKGPFLSSEREWTCYRRNYLACICSYSLSPNFPGAPIQFTGTPLSGSNSSQTFQVYGFAMCISAVVADNDQHNIELVQHTPKRDKGPTSKPSKTLLAPKLISTQHGAGGLNMYPEGSTLTTNARSLYTEGYGGQQQGPVVGQQQMATEHTFERIQFKQATQNNGKRRAAQQYYHLVVELWADVGTQAAEQFVKVAFRKSAKMIVRGRSPGHYQNERRNSHGNGTSGAAGSGGYRPIGEFGNSSGMAGTGLGYNSHAAYDTRGSNYNHVRHQDMSPESIFSTSNDEKPSMGKAYHHQYYTGSTYESNNSHDRVDLFGHGQSQSHSHSHSHRNGTDVSLHSNINNGNGNGNSTDTGNNGQDHDQSQSHGRGRNGHNAAVHKVKPEFDFNMLPSPFSGGGPGTGAGTAHTARPDDHHRERFDGRPSSGGFYPSMPSIVSPTGLGAI